jgi:GT2 family glycosyltransferase
MPPLHPSDISIISVCYKSDAVIGDMVASIPAECPIILVDNGGSNNFDQTSFPPTVSIVRLEENAGFGRGCNAGAAAARTSWLLFLNPDARLSSGAIEALIETARRHPDSSAFNPRIATADGSAYFKRRSYLLPKREYMARGWPETDCQIPILSGAAIFVSKEKFNTVGGFDPNIFLYHEDDDLSLRLRQLGPLMFVRNALVTHSAGHSSGRSSDIAYLKGYAMAQSRIYTGRKHHRPFPYGFSVLEALLFWLSPMTYLSSRKRAKARGWTARVWQERNG